MKPKGVIGEQIEKAVEEAKAAVSPLKTAEEVVAAVTGGKVSAQSLSELEEKDRQEKTAGIPYFQRVIREEQEAAAQVKGGGSVDGTKVQKAALDAAATREGTKEMKIVKPPGDLKRRLPWQKPVKGKPEIKGFSTG